jgi:hypothetical protein
MRSAGGEHGAGLRQRDVRPRRNVAAGPVLRGGVRLGLQAKGRGDQYVHVRYFRLIGGERNYELRTMYAEHRSRCKLGILDLNGCKCPVILY